ncbi:hypothetical protein KEM48_009472 [Puccinia striiformis f. sp. tritici PST-130]|nr:hypothetical protein KEM48_009472 [Puccinia striiformis f. sp. tritici PST-130]
MFMHHRVVSFIISSPATQWTISLAARLAVFRESETTYQTLELVGPLLATVESKPNESRNRASRIQTEPGGRIEYQADQAAMALSVESQIAWRPSQIDLQRCLLTTAP